MTNGNAKIELSLLVVIRRFAKVGKGATGPMIEALTSGLGGHGRTSSRGTAASSSRV